MNYRRLFEAGFFFVAFLAGFVFLAVLAFLAGTVFFFVAAVFFFAGAVFFFASADFFSTAFLAGACALADAVAGAAAAGADAIEWIANIAPCRSVPCVIQSPPGTSIGPLITFAPAFTIASADFLASGILMYGSHVGGQASLSAC